MVYVFFVFYVIGLIKLRVLLNLKIVFQICCRNMILLVGAFFYILYYFFHKSRKPELFYSRDGLWGDDSLIPKTFKHRWQPPFFFSNPHAQILLYDGKLETLISNFEPLFFKFEKNLTVSIFIFT